MTVLNSEPYDVVSRSNQAYETYPAVSAELKYSFVL